MNRSFDVSNYERLIVAFIDAQGAAEFAWNRANSRDEYNHIMATRVTPILDEIYKYTRPPYDSWPELEAVRKKWIANAKSVGIKYLPG